MFGKMPCRFHEATTRWWQVCWQRATALELLPHAPVAIADERFECWLTYEDKRPVLEIASTGRMNASYNNFFQGLFGNRIWFEAADCPSRVDNFENSWLSHWRSLLR